MLANKWIVLCSKYETFRRFIIDLWWSAVICGFQADPGQLTFSTFHILPTIPHSFPVFDSAFYFPHSAFRNSAFYQHPLFYVMLSSQWPDSTTGLWKWRSKRCQVVLFCFCTRVTRMHLRYSPTPLWMN